MFCGFGQEGPGVRFGARPTSSTLPSQTNSLAPASDRSCKDIFRGLGLGFLPKTQVAYLSNPRWMGHQPTSIHPSGRHIPSSSPLVGERLSAFWRSSGSATATQARSPTCSTRGPPLHQFFLLENGPPVVGGGVVPAAFAGVPK